AAMGQPGDAIEGSSLVPRPVGGFGMKSISFDLVDAHTGLPVPRMDAWLHHFVIAQMFQNDPACPGHKVSGYDVAPMVGTGQERTPIAFPDPYAILISAGGWWGGLWHVMNMTDLPMDVKITYTIGMQVGASATNTRRLTPFWADSYSCPAGTTWNVAGNGGPGSVETLTQSYTIPADGIVVGDGGHMHGGGIDIVTRHGDGSMLCTNTAHYMLGMENMDGMIESISACAPHDTVTKGERISVTSHYDNSAPHQDVMGMSVLYLWYGKQPPAPAAPVSPTPTDPATTIPDPDTPGSLPANAVPAVPNFTG
ncbi:MAG TPA: hypothetical protein VIJ47_00880, partial [Acidimicrobiales bacterium]